MRLMLLFILGLLGCSSLSAQELHRDFAAIQERGELVVAQFGGGERFHFFT